MPRNPYLEGLFEVFDFRTGAARRNLCRPFFPYARAYFLCFRRSPLVLSYAEDKLEEIDSLNWTPNVEDVLHARCTTSGVTISKFVAGTEEWTRIRPPDSQQHCANNCVLFSFLALCLFLHPHPLHFCCSTVIDVGGQPGQRKKWASAVKEDTVLSSVFFFVAADEYDVPCEEAPNKTKLQTSLSTASFARPKHFVGASLLTSRALPVLSRNLARGHGTWWSYGQRPRCSGAQQNGLTGQQVERRRLRQLHGSLPRF